jgi:25S rRNA (uracil2843-N3)-methyltransferase
MGQNGREVSSRPGWRGPGSARPSKPKPAPKPTKEKVSAPELPIPDDLLQSLLNIFRTTFPMVYESSELNPILQEVKKALFERDFQTAFGKEEYLEAYSARWSPSRALGYACILADLKQHLNGILSSPADGSSDAGASNSGAQIACFGGGAAEAVAFGGFLHYLKGSLRSSGLEDAPENPDTANSPKVALKLIDSAAWGGVVSKLETAITSPPVLSKYASSAAKASGTPLVEKSEFTAAFLQQDALAMEIAAVKDVLGDGVSLTTLLFTLNELYTASIGKTTSFLLNLTAAAKPGSLLLVVDSPGSYSEATLGKEPKKYPMQWLLNHTLLEKTKLAGPNSAAAWETVVTDDSRWFRLLEGLRYPIPLENMRYQVHLFRRVARSQPK